MLQSKLLLIATVITSIVMTHAAVDCGITAMSSQFAEFYIGSSDGHKFNEISGLATSRQLHDGKEVFWALNDGADRRLGAFSKDGTNIIIFSVFLFCDRFDWDILALILNISRN